MANLLVGQERSFFTAVNIVGYNAYLADDPALSVTQHLGAQGWAIIEGASSFQFLNVKDGTGEPTPDGARSCLYLRDQSGSTNLVTRRSLEGSLLRDLFIFGGELLVRNIPERAQSNSVTGSFATFASWSDADDPRGINRSGRLLLQAGNNGTHYSWTVGSVTGTVPIDGNFHEVVARIAPSPDGRTAWGTMELFIDGISQGTDNAWLDEAGDWDTELDLQSGSRNGTSRWSKIMNVQLQVNEDDRNYVMQSEGIDRNITGGLFGLNDATIDFPVECRDAAQYAIIELNFITPTPTFINVEGVPTFEINTPTSPVENQGVVTAYIKKLSTIGATQEYELIVVHGG